MDAPPPADQNKALFLNLVTMLSMSALQALGKLPHPLSGKTGVQLEAAQATIDMLDMLEAKTRGHRDAEEERALQDTLSLLKMNFVETKDQAGDRGPMPQPPPPTGQASDQAPPPGGEAAPEPKFHKSYD